ncbi:MAG: hypothetical protein ACLTAS_03695 [Butyribacter sp.]
MLNGKKAAGMEKLAAGDVVKLFLADDTIDKFRGIAGAEKQYISKADTTSKKQRVKLDIIFEDEDILVVNKPVDMLSQKADKNDISLVEHITWYLESQKDNEDKAFRVFKPGICNRALTEIRAVLSLREKSIKGLQSMNELFREKT